MAPERVIQDSDDEDFEEIPTSAHQLQQSSPPPSLRVNGGVAPSPAQEEGQSNAKSGEVKEGPSPKVTSGADLDVNFDEYLHSQSQSGHLSVSPIQFRQRREGEVQVLGGHGQSLGEISNAQSALWESGAQSPLNSKLKRTQTIASLDEIEGAQNNNSKKPAKRCKTMDVGVSKAPPKQQLSPNTSDVHVQDDNNVANNVERRGSNEGRETNDTHMPLNEETSPPPANPSVSQRRTQGDDTGESAHPRKPSHIRASIVSKSVDDACDRDQLCFEKEYSGEHTVNVQIAKGLTHSEEQEYKTLNGVGLAPNIQYDHSQTPRVNNQEDSAMADEGSKPDETSHDHTGRESTPRQVNSVQVVVAVSPHDTEQLSSFSSVPPVQTTSPSPVGEPSQSTPGDPFDETPPKEVAEKPSRKRMATIVDDSDESPDELNPLIDPPKENRKPQLRRIRGTNADTDTRHEDKDILAALRDRRGSRKTSRSAEISVERPTEIIEDGRSTLIESSNSDELGMPPKEQYRPRPSRSRGNPIESVPEPPEFPWKESKKKKIKRGKTTSVMLKKSIESDVEDDVVWVDEKPTGVVFRDPILPARRKAKRSGTAGVYTEPNAAGNYLEETVNDGSIPAQELQEKESSTSNAEKTAEGAPAAPKKRGRKRKKTVETPVPPETTVEEKPPARQDEEEPNQETDITPDDEDKTIDPLDKSQVNPTPESPAGNTGNEEPIDPKPENPESAPPETIPAETPHFETPKKQTAKSKTTSTTEETMTPPPHSSSLKGPDKHSPISTTGSVPLRVGLSRRANIAPLLKIVRK